jgi:hypothetical protein
MKRSQSVLELKKTAAVAVSRTQEQVLNKQVRASRTPSLRPPAMPRAEPRLKASRAASALLALLGLRAPCAPRAQRPDDGPAQTAVAGRRHRDA